MKFVLLIRIKMLLATIFLLLASVALVCFSQNDTEEEEDDEAQAQKAAAILPVTPGTTQTDELIILRCDDLDLDSVLEMYTGYTGQALMKEPGLPAVKITLKCPKKLPKKEVLLAIEGVLAMNGVGLVPLGTNFLKVVKIDTARTHGMKTEEGEIGSDIASTDHLVSRIIELKHLEIAEAQTAIQGLMHSYAKIIPLERINCLLITETANNLKRIMEILGKIDQPIESREELRIFPIQYAKASEIQNKIDAIIGDIQAKGAKTRVIQQQLTAARLPFQPVQPGQPPGGTPTETSAGALDRSLIQSRVKMVADDRINSLIVITRKEQFDFIEKIIKELDRKMEPDVSIKVIELEYAHAEDVMKILTSLLTAPAGTKQPTPAQPFQPPPEPAKKTPTEKGKTDTSKGAEGGEEQISGKLSAEVKIISDKRINALLVMACKADMQIIEGVVEKVDKAMSQVLIEVVIVEVDLSDEFKMGIDWLQRSMIAYNNKAGGGRRAFLGYSGASKAGTKGTIKDATTINKVSDDTTAAGSGLTYYFTYFDWNIDAVLNMLATTSGKKILGTPVILTSDNQEAKLMIGEQRPIVTSTSISGGGVQQSAYEYKKIGIELTVTPRINRKGFVNMDINQKVDNKGDDVIIDGNPVPVITTRDFDATISVNDGRTIVIGGIVTTEKENARTKIPLLGDIPLLGMLFRYDYIKERRVELMVMITPYVLETPDEAYGETARRQASLSHISNLWVRGWSPSDLAAPSPEEVKAIKAAKRKREQTEAAEEEQIYTPPKEGKFEVLKYSVGPVKTNLVPRQADVPAEAEENDKDETAP
jgi:general secretion pathway protein D